MKASSASSSARRSDALNSFAPNTVERFRLSGPTPRLDPRTNAIRRDIADIALASRIFAPHYARPLLHGCDAARTTMRSAPSDDALAVSELLQGEGFALIDASGDWGWGYSRHDGYVGYVRCSVLGTWTEPTHRVACPAALVFARPDIKARVLGRLPMGAQVAGQADGSGFVRTPGGYIHPRHLEMLSEHAIDPVIVAERLIGTPYRWGGRSGDGIDCSGLVQLALGFAGVAAPRDSDQQRALGVEIAANAPLMRGDMIFLPGHVGLMADDHRLVHANAHWMATVSEPLGDVLARQPADGGIIARRRLAW